MQKEWVTACKILSLTLLNVVPEICREINERCERIGGCVVADEENGTLEE